jgi:hypothetical protein
LTSDGVLGNKPDTGVDFYANKLIDFGSKLTNGSTKPNRPDSVQVGVGPNGMAFVDGHAFRRRKDAAKFADFIYAGAPTGAIILDATAEGPSSTNPSVVLTQALPQETPTPTEEANLSAARLQQLIKMGIYGRQLTTNEMVGRASGRVLYIDTLPQREIYSPMPKDYQVAASKLPSSLATDLVRMHDEVLGTEDKEQKEQARHELKVAYDAYRKAYPTEAFDPVTFRTFVRDGDFHTADNVLSKMARVFQSMDNLSLTKKQSEFCRKKLVADIQPNLGDGDDEPGLDADKLEQVIRAKPARTLQQVVRQTP